MYCAKFNRDDIAKFGDPFALRNERLIQLRLKRMREYLLDEGCECHPLKGWYRCDVLARCREISCTTIATKLLNDPSLYPITQFQMRRIRFRKPDPVSVVRTPALQATPTGTSGEVGNQSTRGVSATVGSGSASSSDEGESDSDDSAEEERMIREEDERLAKEAEEKKVEQSKVEEDDGEDDGEDDVDDQEEEMEEEETAKPMDIEKEDVPQQSQHISIQNYQVRSNIEERQRVFAEAHASLGKSILLKSSNSRNMSGDHVTKGIEQLHMETGKVLHRYSSGTEAANLMQMSQSGISLCCTGVKPDVCGFRWRFYVGSTDDCKCFVLYFATKLHFSILVDKPYFNEGPDILPINELINMRQNCRAAKVSGIDLALFNDRIL